MGTREQAGTVLYVVGLLIGFVLAAMFAPLAALAGLLWSPPDDYDLDEVMEMLSRCSQ